VIQQVTGVVWWRMGLSHYTSLYRRAQGDEPRAGFTRDYLQASGIRDYLREMLEGRPPYEPLTYRWPSGSYTNGRIYPAADYDRNGRVEVGQFLGGVPPEPWRIGDPAGNPNITLPGDTSLGIPDEARAQWENDLAPLMPFLVMVQLERNRQELHIRAYLGNPPEHLAAASLDNVPQSLRDRMTQRRGPHAGALVRRVSSMGGRSGPIFFLPEELWFDDSDLRTPWHTTRPPILPSGGVPPLPPEETDVVGQAYQPANEEVESAAGEPFDVDPDERDRANRAHNKTQNALAALLEASGRTPRSPRGEPNFDLAWDEPDGPTVVVEVKSVTAANAERQLRLGLGQVLRYRQLLGGDGRDVRAVLALSAAPADSRWLDLCRSHGVGLIWLPEVPVNPTDWLA